MTLMTTGYATEPAPARTIRVGPDPENYLVNRRMNESQQMSWSIASAHQLLQVRAALINGDFDSLVRPRIEPLAPCATQEPGLAA